MQKIKIDIVSDVNCPWCYLGEQRLKKAMAASKENVEFDIHFKPFELSPQAPAEGEDKKAYFSRNYGPNALARIEASSAQLAELGRQEGIVFNFDKSAVIHNTLNAHRLLWLAEQHACQEAVATALFVANFTEGANINDPALLQEIGLQAGIPAAVLTDFFSSDRGLAEVRALEGWAQQAGISGVPAFIFNDQYLVSGAQPTETLQQIFQQLTQEAVTATKANSCDLDDNC